MAFKSDRQRKAAFANINKGSRTTTRGSGEGKQMNAGLQAHNLKQELKRSGIDSDKVDVQAEIDPTLRYGENKTNLMRKISMNTEKYYGESLDSDELSFEKDQANDFHSRRTEKAQMMDNSRQADEMITDRQITKNPVIINLWYKEPNRLDVQGVDDY